MTNWLDRSFQRLRSLFRRAQLDRDLDAEMSARRAELSTSITASAE